MLPIGMDPNERLLWRVMQERSGRGRFLGLRGEWLLLGALALVVVVALPLARTVAHGGSAGEARAAGVLHARGQQ